MLKAPTFSWSVLAQPAPYAKRLFSLTHTDRHGILTSGIIVALITAVYLSFGLLPVAGVYITVSALAGLLSVAVWNKRLRDLALSVAIIPLALMVTVALPNWSAFVQMAVMYEVLLAVSIATLVMLQPKETSQREAFSWSYYVDILPAIIIAGQLLGLLGHMVLPNQSGLVGEPTALLVAGALLFAVTEEVLFRGLIQRQAARLMAPGLAAALSAVLFAVVTSAVGSATRFALSLLIGLVLSFVYLQKRNLALTIALNAASKLTFVWLLVLSAVR